ncbi:MAG TPA: hypothetical protein VF753_04095 [Terriglobales bacterium]
MKFVCALAVCLTLVSPALAVDREAFTFTKYDLDARVEPEQQRLSVRGKIWLRNDSGFPQKNVALQISSTLVWRSITITDTPAEFSSHEYTSDIDHTGGLSEAIVNLTKDAAPGTTLEIEIGYEGTIPLNATRLTRIGVPEDKAKQNDWDEIGKATAVRGVGYVTWYPVAMDAANLSDGDSVSTTIGRWKARNADASMDVRFESSVVQTILFSGSEAEDASAVKAPNFGAFHISAFELDVPTFLMGDYIKVAPKEQPVVFYFPGQDDAAKTYADAASVIDTGVPNVGGVAGNLWIVGLPNPAAATFVTGSMLLAPLKLPVTNETMLNLAYAKVRSMVASRRAWIEEGLAHYGQVAFVENEAGRQTALNYLSTHAVLLTEEEKTAAKGTDQDSHSLINAPDGLYLQTKSMFVWSMLRDMLGKLPADALATYRSADDRDASYMQKLIEKDSHRELQWFFEDWVYHDRGLPDFRVESAYPHQIDTGAYVVTVTIENLGAAGAEVPVTLHIPRGDITRRLEVRGKAKASLRIEVPTLPDEITVNDGSVPESDMSNNTYKLSH